MMDKTYIQDQGILELYVLGELNESEQQQVEEALTQYPDLRSELERIEIKFETLAFEQAIEAPDSVKNALLKEASLMNSKTLPLSYTKNNGSYMAIAASITGLLLVGSIYLYLEWTTAKNKLKLVEDQNKELNIKIDDLANDLDTTRSLFALINNPNTEKYILKGNELMPDAKVISYVNNSEKSVVINTEYLPELDNEHDYQMWADVQGEMIDMGIIDTHQTMLAMNYIENSESLNITIEPAGGNDHPTVSKLITNVYLK
ncbi:anti-sigma factor domain-containing protein [Psychroserpens mesophilus]|uniref:anti-sigma factor domain-containing protein n=1 Tax=Psychroserpens mesophilus TaxID=325473 RepID=UPI003F49620D